VLRFHLHAQSEHLLDSHERHPSNNTFPVPVLPNCHCAPKLTLPFSAAIRARRGCVLTTFANRVAVATTQLRIKNESTAVLEGLKLVDLVRFSLVGLR
jgi:hypothetical protein